MGTVLMQTVHMADILTHFTSYHYTQNKKRAILTLKKVPLKNI